MELGGHAPFVVFEDANIDEAVTGAMQSKFRNSGQTCICANRIFVHEKVYDKFLDKFTQEVNKIKVVLGYKNKKIKKIALKNKKITFVINSQYFKGVSTSIKTGLKKISKKKYRAITRRDSWHIKITTI